MLFLSTNRSRKSAIAFAATILLTVLVVDFAYFGRVAKWLWRDDGGDGNGMDRLEQDAKNDRNGMLGWHVALVASSEEEAVRVGIIRGKRQVVEENEKTTTTYGIRFADYITTTTVRGATPPLEWIDLLEAKREGKLKGLSRNADDLPPPTAATVDKNEGPSSLSDANISPEQAVADEGQSTKSPSEEAVTQSSADSQQLESSPEAVQSSSVASSSADASPPEQTTTTTEEKATSEPAKVEPSEPASSEPASESATESQADAPEGSPKPQAKPSEATTSVTDETAEKSSSESPQEELKTPATTTTSDLTAASPPPSGGFGCPNQAHTQGHWVPKGDGYEWILDDPANCQLEEFNRENFCKALAGRNFLLVGDSLTKASFHYIKPILNATNCTIITDDKNYRRPQSTSGHCKMCPDSRRRSSFMRNDHLTIDGLAEGRDLSEHQNWFPIIDQYDFVILNQGAHVLKGGRFEGRIKQVHNALQENYTGHVLWRTTPRGHIGCSEEDVPIGELGEEDPNYDRFFIHPDKKYKKYSYTAFPVHNEVLRRYILNKTSPTSNSKHTFVDVARITEMRPDEHAQPPRDCLHYKTTANGPVRAWWWLIQNAMQGYL